MSGIRRCDVPEGSLLHRYVASGAFADCYATEVARAITHADFVEAFYTTALFKLERALLGRLAARPSNDDQAGALARGKRDTFAAWKVEARAPGELLLSDFSGRTRSWLMVAAGSEGAPATRLCFGSAVVPLSSRSGQARMGAGFTALLGFHKLYSRALLFSARRRLARRVTGPLE